MKANLSSLPWKTHEYKVRQLHLLPAALLKPAHTSFLCFLCESTIWPTLLSPPFMHQEIRNTFHYKLSVRILRQCFFSQLNELSSLLGHQWGHFFGFIFFSEKTFPRSRNEEQIACLKFQHVLQTWERKEWLKFLTKWEEEEDNSFLCIFVWIIP